MTLASRLAGVVADLTATGTPVVAGPPFTDPPAAPCYIVNLPQVLEVVGAAGPACRVTSAAIDIICVPPTATDRAGLLTMADDAITALGGRVTAGQAEPADLTDIDATVYRLTVED